MSILIKGICKSFGEQKVLQDIDFEFADSSVNMIIGASGSGKTVLAKCIVGLLKPDKGEIYYDGVDFLKLNEKELRLLRRKIGMLFQSSALFDSKTVGENVAFPLEMFTKMSKNEIKDRVAFCLERVNLPGTESKYPSELSGGMKKRVGIARAIALNPKYLFCDEPNSGLDPKTAEVIDHLIEDITDEFKTTTIVISHDIKSVLTIGDKILFISKGRKEWEGTRQEIPSANNATLQDFIKTSGVNLQVIRY
ncbi:MAG: ABC transporter ATP-binding protein [Bacteroidia bacterium]|nr:ABC transporter ATP-binding protein [Bacteroidia bacterium]MDW8158268.1 ABC transporter ATP-binding protein [Bacteroidia bacterium]